MNTIDKFLQEANHPNVDMIIPKANLYMYVPTERIDDIKINGIRTDDGELVCYFTRIPRNEKYLDFLDSYTPIRVSYSKVAKIKNQKVVIKPKNFKSKKETLNGADIIKIASNNKFFTQFFNSNQELSKIPCCSIIVQDNVLPSFTFKVINDEFGEDD